MKKMNKHSLRGFVTGVLVSAMVMTCASPVWAAMKQITVSIGGIDIYVDQQLKVPTSATGKRVDPIVYDGTTYLPVRAISNMLGKEVAWDQATKSIYIGKAPSKGTQGVLAENLTKFSGSCNILTGSSAKYKILGDEFTPFNAIKSYSGDNIITWKLDSKYQSIDGKFVMSYSSLGDSKEVELQFYNVDQYGEETLISSFTNKCGDGSMDVHVDVTACDFIRVKMVPISGSGYDSNVFYDITATTAA